MLFKKFSKQAFNKFPKDFNKKSDIATKIINTNIPSDPTKISSLN